MNPALTAAFIKFLDEFNCGAIGFDLGRPANENDVLELLEAMQLAGDETPETVIGTCKAAGCYKRK